MVPLVDSWRGEPPYRRWPKLACSIRMQPQVAQTPISRSLLPPPYTRIQPLSLRSAQLQLILSLSVSPVVVVTTSAVLATVFRADAMRSYPSVAALLFSIALVLTVCLTPSVSADANITVYIDASCSAPFGEPAQIPFASSSLCHQLPGLSSSFHFLCAVDANTSTTHFSFSLYNATNCSGAVVESIQSDGPSGQCVDASVNLQGEQFDMSAQIACTSSQQLPAALATTTTTTASQNKDVSDEHSEEVDKAGAASSRQAQRQQGVRRSVHRAANQRALR